MKKITHSFCIALLLSLAFNAYCQTANVHIGERCPDVLITRIVNYTTKSAKISDFSGKLLILDFWATWCAPCVDLMPVSASLQEKFKGKILLLPVTDQDEATVTAFLKSINRIKHINPPSVTGDTILRAMFGHTEIPHLVWIDREGKVLAITGAEALTAANIQKYLDGKSQPMALKQDVVKTINEHNPMFVTGNELIEGSSIRLEKIPDSDVLFHSVMTKYIDGFGCEDGGGTNKLTCKNNSIGTLYRFAAGHDNLKMLLLNSTIWEVTNPAVKEFSDSAALVMDDSRAMEWLRRYSFCYELKFPPSVADRKFGVMLSDLNMFFGAVFHIEGGLEKRKTKCLALVQTGTKELFASKGLAENYISNEYHLKLSNKPVKTLLSFLSIRLDMRPPLVDETGYTGPIDIDLNCNLSDISAVNESLAKYGLQLQEKEIEREMVVIKDKL